MENNHSDYSDYKDFLRRSPRWRDTRLKAYIRANFACQRCKRTESLHCHHTSYGKTPDDFYSLDNILAVCARCHEFLHGFRSDDPAEIQPPPST
jgi:5-methylcytosine-specific restriction endonuclease McrA